jgi:hypothetical protein
VRLGSRREGPEEQGGGGMANAPSMKRKLPAAVSAAGCLRRREEAPVKYVRGFFFSWGLQRGFRGPGAFSARRLCTGPGHRNSNSIWPIGLPSVEDAKDLITVTAYRSIPAQHTIHQQHAKH